MMPNERQSSMMAISDLKIKDERFRIEMTVSCQDAASIPKVLGAGQVFRENGVDIQLMHNGVRVVAGGYYGQWMSEVIKRLHGHHEPQEEAVFHELLKLLPDRPTMIELGAFWSYYSLWCLETRPRARVIAVEPDPNNIEIGRRNASLNDRSIDFIHASAGSKTLSSKSFKTETGGTIDLAQVCVAEILKTRNIGILDVLHCDTQGAETAILESCIDLFRSGVIKFCVVSTHHHSISGDPLTHQRCLELLQGAGGKILAEHDVAESFSGDGLIVSYFGKEPIYWREPPLTYNRYSKSLFRNPLFDLAEKK